MAHQYHHQAAEQLYVEFSNSFYCNSVLTSLFSGQRRLNHISFAWFVILTVEFSKRMRMLSSDQIDVVY